MKVFWCKVFGCKFKIKHQFRNSTWLICERCKKEKWEI